MKAVVDFKISAFVVLISALAASASPFNKRTVAQVEADIATINSKLTTLNSAINSVPDSGGSLLQALAMNKDSLTSAIIQGTTDVTSTGAFSDADATAILQSLEAIQPTIIDALNAIVAKKPAFQGLPIGGVTALVKQDIGNLNSNMTAFASALIAATPTVLKANATAIKTALDAAFENAVAAYADA
ncbi:hydrophobic surface binding protein A-domain-containing protein [Gautieria morchelliformis]|nr:hydrophobic surface binding protein A-domain-containing protein [Gautieria morchelliformis]